eukprot:CAMPEP_0118958646 /NCGR_PEP_ID=MMETSP1169-20130426/62728_1 /TAXON_ID=36882 /ORGANISM="Pyramimonas obovata, Strain CCMP722" /LENGTH=655 /DNA_ID=CAMNT_0006906771 /DNA_START=610 /DNA_END=2577 /DNA_ORIENTATION=-
MRTLFYVGVGLTSAWLSRNAYCKRFCKTARDRRTQLRRLHGAVKESQTFEEWFEAAKTLETFQLKDKPRQEHGEFDKELVTHRLQTLQANREDENVGDMMFALRADLLRSLGNMAESRIHNSVSVPPVIKEYTEEVRLQLKIVTEKLDIPLEEKLTFLQEVRHVFGRTALMLSGAGMHGAFHLGVIKGLENQDQLPRVIAGSSVGSIVSAYVGTRTPEELRGAFSDDNFASTVTQLAFFNGQSLSAALAHATRGGCGGHVSLHDYGFFKRRVKQLLGDLTFQEAYDRSGGRILCVCVCPEAEGQEPFLLNHLTAPHCVVWSAIAASCAFPCMFPPQMLLSKSRTGAVQSWQPAGGTSGMFMWRSGLVHDTASIRGLRELFNVNYFVVVQTNPAVTAILALKHAVATLGGLYAKLADAWELEFKHRLRQLTEVTPWLDVFGVARTLQQQWEGDVTVVMRAGAASCLLLARSTPSDLYAMATQGERTAWTKIGAVATATGIERQLDESVALLRRMQQSACSLSGKNRLPSWNAVMNAEMVISSRDPSFGGGSSRTGGSNNHSSNTVNSIHDDHFSHYSYSSDTSISDTEDEDPSNVDPRSPRRSGGGGAPPRGDTSSRFPFGGFSSPVSKLVNAIRPHPPWQDGSLAPRSRVLGHAP